MLEIMLKRIIIKSTLLFFVLFIVLPNLKIKAQCLPGSLSRECIRSVSEGFIYLKSYSIDGQDNSKEKIEYTAVMSKDTQYAFKICTPHEGADGIVLTIYDLKRNEIISNRNETLIDSELNYMCTSTGIYYIRFTFFESKNRCGGCILSFKKSQN
jgi:hypothetical protein